MVSPVLVVVAAALVNPTSEILLSCRPAGKSMAGMWEFPGGKLEKNETPEAALVRELKEEIGLDVRPADLEPLTFASHTYPDFHLLMPFYLVRHWQGIPMPHEGQTLRWFQLEEIDTSAMPPPDGPLVERVREALGIQEK